MLDTSQGIHPSNRHGWSAPREVGVGDMQLKMTRAQPSSSIQSSKEDSARACADGFKWGPRHIKGHQLAV